MKIAIITGASSGLGSEFVRQISRKEKLDEIWVIARRKERLTALQKESQTHLRIITGLPSSLMYLLSLKKGSR